VITTDVAWAAGFFDAEGSVVLRRQRRTWRLELEATQAGEGPPPVLLRFRAACGGRGTITGPRRGYLYYWRASGGDDIGTVLNYLGPWISEPKRDAVRSACEMVGRPISLAWPAERTRECELAWAAGLYGGDGSTSAGLNKAGGPTYRTLKAGIPQAAVQGGVPPVLTRFRAAVNAGSVRGPYTLKNPWSRQPQFVWSINGIRGVEPVLELIWPWLDDAKRHQARVAIRAARACRHRPLPPPSACFEL